MEKIRIFRSKNIAELEKLVNDFIKDKVVIDIKYQSEFVGTSYNSVGVPVNVSCYDSVMVFYMEDDK